MKTNNLKSRVAALLLTTAISVNSVLAQGGSSQILTKTQNLSQLILDILDIVVMAVAAGAFVWMVIGIFTKAQDIKQRVLYFVIGAVLLGLKSVIVSALMNI